MEVHRGVVLADGGAPAEYSRGIRWKEFWVP